MTDNSDWIMNDGLESDNDTYNMWTSPVICTHPASPSIGAPILSPLDPPTPPVIPILPPSPTWEYNDNTTETYIPEPIPDTNFSQQDILCVGKSCVLHEQPPDDSYDGFLRNFPKAEQHESDKYSEKYRNAETKNTMWGGVPWIVFPKFLKNKNKLHSDEVFNYVSLGGHISIDMSHDLNNRCAEAVSRKYYPQYNIEHCKANKIYPYNSTCERDMPYNPLIGIHVILTQYNFNISDYAILAKVCIDFMIENKEKVLY